VDDRRDGQTYCDWCYRPLTPRSIEESARLGLDAEYAWACESCLTTKAYQRAPDGWDCTPEPWPFGDA
jgi:Zn-finger protein